MMSQLRVSVFLLLLFSLGCAFLGQMGSSLDPNHIAVGPFVLLLLAVSVMLTLGVPAFRRASGLIVLAATLLIYAIGRLTIFDGRPLFGGYNTYLSLSEGALLVVGAVLAQRLSRSVDRAERTVALLCFDGNSGRVRSFYRAEEEIDRALAVARRHERPLSLVVIESGLPHGSAETDSTVGLSLRLGNLVRHLDGSLRRQELILTAPFERRIVLLLPDTDECGAVGIRTHIAALKPKIDLDLQTSAAVFPAHGLTFQELLSHAAEQLSKNAGAIEDAGLATDDRQLEAG